MALYTRRNFITTLLGAGVTGLAGLTYFRKIEPFRLKEVPTTIKLSKDGSAAPFTLLHLSDLHVSKSIPFSFIEEAFSLGSAHRPDLICLTGDFITHRVADPGPYVALLKRLAACAPTFACIGNHDGGRWVHPHGGYKDLSVVFQLLEDSGIRCLFNRSESITVRDRLVTLVGLGDLWAGDAHPDKAFEAVAPDPAAIRIVLSHNPDSKNLLQRQTWDLMLCGHTHGGQMVLPFIGTPLAPVADHRYVAGLNAWSNRWIYTTRGVGCLHGIRINCPPEVSILTIT